MSKTNVTKSKSSKNKDKKNNKVEVIEQAQEKEVIEQAEVTSESPKDVVEEELQKISDEEFENKESIKKEVVEVADEGQLTIADDGDLAVDNKMLADSKQEPVQEYVRQKRLDKSEKKVTIQSLYKEWKKDQQLLADRRRQEAEAAFRGEELTEWDDPRTLRFDLAIQRNEVWNDYQRSDLIHSLIVGYYIPPILVQEMNDGKRWFLEGKQRLTNIFTYINGEWALSKNTDDVYGYKIAGRKFKDLPEEMQDDIFGETFTLVSMINLTTEERDKQFIKTNSGTPLSRIELTRAKHSELIESINQIADLKFFDDVVDLSKKARIRFVDQEIILQIAMLIEEGKDNIKGFSANHIEDYVLRLKSSNKTLSDEMLDRFERVSHYLEQAVENFNKVEIKKSLKKIHVPIIFWNAEKAIENNLEPRLFGEFIRSFLVNNYTITSAYGKACQSGSSKKENVLTRIAEMEKYLDMFISLVNKNSDPAIGVVEFDQELAKINGIDQTENADNEEN